MKYNVLYRRRMASSATQGVVFVMSESVNLEYGELSPISGGLVSNYDNFFGSTRSPNYISVAAGYFAATNPVNSTLRVYFYDSQFNYIDGIEYDDSPVELGDEVHYVKLELSGSDLERKTIDVEYTSNKATAEYVKNGPEIASGGASNELHFLYETKRQNGKFNNIWKGDAEDDEVALGMYERQLTEGLRYTSGVLMLPPNYNRNGKPTKLIIFCHSSGYYSSIKTTTHQTTYLPYLRYLANEGYAVFDCFYRDNESFDRVGAMGSQIATPVGVSSVVNGFDWITSRFNIDSTGCYVFGKSLGGIMAMTLPTIPYLNTWAVGLLACTITPFSSRLGYRPSDRIENAMQMGFVGDYETVLGKEDPLPYDEETKDIFRENWEAHSQYNPVVFGLIGVDRDELIESVVGPINSASSGFLVDGKYKDVPRIFPTPVKSWCAADDGIGNIAAGFIQQMNNVAGQIGEVRYLPSGSGDPHHAVDTVGETVSVTTALGITEEEVPLAYAEMVQFFRRFGG